MKHLSLYESFDKKLIDVSDIRSIVVERLHTNEPFYEPLYFVNETAIDITSNIRRALLNTFGIDDYGKFVKFYRMNVLAHKLLEEQFNVCVISGMKDNFNAYEFMKYLPEFKKHGMLVIMIGEALSTRIENKAQTYYVTEKWVRSDKLVDVNSKTGLFEN